MSPSDGQSRPWLAGSGLKRAIRFADKDSGQLAYVNAGHNAPIVWHAGQTNALQATGTALGFFDDTTYDVGRMTLPPVSTRTTSPCCW